MPLIQVDKYMLFSIARTDDSYRQAISLYNSGGQRFASLRYTPGTVGEPQQGADGVYVLNFPIEDYEKAVDMLRNEAPVYLWWGGGPKYLRTGTEDVGEGEIT